MHNPETYLFGITHLAIKVLTKKIEPFQLLFRPHGCDDGVWRTQNSCANLRYSVSNRNSKIANFALNRMIAIKYFMTLSVGLVITYITIQSCASASVN